MRNRDHGGHRAVADRALPFVRVVQDGSDGVNAVFPVEHFDQVAEIIRPRRRRQVNLTPDQRREIGERLARG